MTLIPPTSYQGGKQRIAKKIIDIIQPDGIFCDLCCGSGAISVELLNRGFGPNNVIMLDLSPYALFWKMVGEGSFDLNYFKLILDQVPKDKKEIEPYVKELSKQSADINTVYIYLILQASSFGGKAIWIKDNKWQNCTFRRYWLPHGDCNRKSPVNPMMPMPNTLFERVENICKQAKGVKGLHQDINDFTPPEDAIVYIDIPYKGTTSYGFDFDVMKWTENVKNKIYVSEGKPLSDDYVLISEGRAKGGISGNRSKKANLEYLSTFN